MNQRSSERSAVGDPIMSHDERKEATLPTSAGRARRRFLTKTALATAGASAAALLPGAGQAAQHVAAATTGSCPDVKTPMKEVNDKVAFITGGASGIGLGMAKAFVGAG